MRAVSLYIVVKKIKSEPKMIGGLEISNNIDSDNRYLRGKIVSKGDLCPPDDVIKKDDIVYYDKHAGHEITYNKEQYYVMTIKDIVLVE
jgi:co-chaperonin GroES (HSP10)